MLAKTDFINYRWSVMRARYSSVSVSQLASTKLWHCLLSWLAQEE